MKLKVFHATENDTPKLVKISPYTNKLSQNFAEHVYSGAICRFLRGELQLS